MGEELPKAITSLRAYQLFLHQSREQINHALNLLANQQKSPSEEDLRQLCSSFHKLRGGAGFFGLENIMQCAARLETILGCCTMGHDRCRKALEVANELEPLIRQLPLPEQAPKNEEER